MRTYDKKHFVNAGGRSGSVSGRYGFMHVIKRQLTIIIYFLTLHGAKYDHWIYPGNLNCFKEWIFVLLWQFTNQFPMTEIFDFSTKKVNFQHFRKNYHIPGHFGQQVLTKCWPKYFLLKDHLKLSEKYIYIVYISLILANLRLKTFWTLATAMGP